MRKFPILCLGRARVLVSIQAAGINFPDALVIQGKHQYRPQPHFLRGGELAGVVQALGQDVDGIQIGQRVYASRVRGAFAELIAVDVANLKAIPDGFSFVQAAVLSTSTIRPITPCWYSAAWKPATRYWCSVLRAA